MKRLSYKFIVLTSLFSLTSCGTFHSVENWLHEDKPKQIHIVHTNQNAEQYLQLAATAPSPQQEYYLLLAVEKLIQQNKLTRAEQILATLNTYDVPSDILIKKQLMYAKIQLADQKPKLALEALSKVATSVNMSKKDQLNLHQALATSYKLTGNIVASIQQRNLLEPLLSNQQAKKQNQLTIWESVQHLPKDQIDNLLSQPISPDIRGWLELAQLAQESSLYPNTLIRQLDEWKASYPSHSGNDLLPKQVNYNTRLLAKTHEDIYLLLPLHGHFAKNGQAVRNGFMAAYYDSKERQDTHATIHIIDTSRGDIVSNYQTAVNNGANFIIGPLTKSNIRQLVNSVSLTVPTLTLNYIPNFHAENLYQFGLSQFDEAEQVANQGYLADFHRAIVIAPSAGWGQAIAKRFKEVWKNDGNEVIDTLAYQNSNDLSKPIRDLLEVNQSESRAKSLQSVLHDNDVRFVPNRRNDVDMIFLVALPGQARSIRPMLKFYWAGDIPVYATSLIYEPAISTEKNRDLDQIKFPDMPWVIGGLSERLKLVQEKSKTLWSKSYKNNTKFYALGVDAFGLTKTLSQLAIFPHYAVPGATGNLYLRGDNHIYRKLKWVEMKNGQPRPMNT